VSGLLSPSASAGVSPERHARSVIRIRLCSPVPKRFDETGAAAMVSTGCLTPSRHGGVVGSGTGADAL